VKRTAVMSMILASLLSLFVAAGAWGQNRQEIIPVDDDAYVYLDLILLESGFPQISTFRPFTAQEFDEYLALVPPGRLSAEGSRMLELIEERLDRRPLLEESGLLGFSSELEVNAEYYAKRNADADYVSGYGDRLPMVSIPLDLWFFDSVYANSTLSVREDYRLSAGRWDSIAYSEESGGDFVHDNHWNFISDVLEVDFYFPFRALLSVGGPHWHFTYGRDSLSVGNGRRGNLLLSDFVDYYDTAILTTHWNIMKYTANYTYFEPWLTPLDQERLSSGEYFMRIKDYELPYKALMMHHLELRPFISFPRLPQVNLFIAEAIMFGSQYPQLRDFNPFMIFHNWFEYERSNDSFLLGISIAPVRFVELYGQYFLNEFDTEYEGGNNFPGADGILGGVSAALPLPVGYASGWVEGARTDPLLYNRYHPLVNFVSRRRIWSYIEPDQMIWVDKPIGYFAGPDALTLSAGLEYRIGGLLTAEAGFMRVEKGEKETGSPYKETPGETTPTGIPEISTIITFAFEVTPLPVVSIGASIASVYDRNADHIEGAERRDLQFSAHLSIHASGPAIGDTARRLRSQPEP
jgi:hypothetical protein